MSSIRKTQIEQVLADTVRLLYSQGVKPTSTEVNKLTSRYLSEYPAGTPLNFDLNEILDDEARSNPDKFNEMLLKIITNMNVLYKTSFDQVADVMLLNTELREQLKLLKDKRRKLAAKIDDQLLSLYNTDGYYYSASDSFSDLDLVDLSLTSAFIDTTEGAATLPIVSRFSNRIEPTNIYSSNIQATVNGLAAPFAEISPVSYALDGNTNTVWSVEVETASIQEVVLTLTLALSAEADVSRVDVDPYGLTPAQWAVDVASVVSGGGVGDYQTFGSSVSTTVDRFTKRGEAVGARNVRLTIRKTRPDYEETKNGQVRYRYIFGAKEIALSYQVYDNLATVVSIPLVVPGEGNEGYIIDAVSLSTKHDTPEGTDINFYVAEHLDTAVEISDYDWKPIEPVNDESGDQVTVRFDGATKSIRSIVDKPTAGELQKIATDTVNGDLSKRNPTRSIIDGVDVYRIAQFDETPLLDTLKLHEGINTVKVYHRSLSDFAVESLEWWTDKRDDAQVEYSRIDVGHEFFYGGDVGESGRSVLIETYVDIPGDIDPVLAVLKKSDENSRTWKVRAFLNGKETGFVDAGVPSLNIPWPFKKGLNHVCLLVNIPNPSAIVPNPYVGTIDLFSGEDLFDYGLVRLDAWSYIDMFDMTHNQPNASTTFTIYNGELVSKRKPTDNMRLTYSKQTDKGPSAVRVRADFRRDSTASPVTPVLDQYRLRFSYSED